MTLPSFRLSFLRGWLNLASVSRGLFELLRGKVVSLPEALGRAELEDLVDALAILLDVPVSVIGDGTPEEAPGSRGTILVYPNPMAEPPEPMPDAVVVCAHSRPPGSPNLGLPHAVLTIRDALIDCLGRRFSPRGLAKVASWVGGVADTPATAARFADGALTFHLRAREANDADLYCAGLAAVLGWMLHAVDPRVAQWVLVLALRSVEPGKRVSTEAVILGRDEALRRALEAGLLYRLPERESEPLDFRRPLHVLGKLAEAPGAPTVAQLTRHLGAQVHPAVREVVTRLEQPRRALDLAGPLPPSHFVGRADLLQRLATLLEPSDQVLTCVLYGVAGSGKTATATMLVRALERRLEPLWVHFAQGPTLGWLPAAAVLKVDPNAAGATRTDAAGVPQWVHRLHEQLRLEPYLVVVDGVDDIPEAALPAWLPSGPGQCAVLVLSRLSQRTLQRTHDAIAIHMPALTLEEGRRLLELRASDLRGEISRGDADALIERVDRHPVALTLLAELLGSEGIEGASQRLSREQGAEGIVPRVIGEVVGRLGASERAIVDALTVCSPAGSSIDLVLRISEVSDGRAEIDALAEMGLLVRDAHTSQLHPLVRLDAERVLGQDTARRQQWELRHARAVASLMAVAIETVDLVNEQNLYGDLIAAVDRMIHQVGSGNVDAASVCSDAAKTLSDYPLSNRAENLGRAINAFRTILSVHSREVFPVEWAATQNNLGIALYYLPAGDRAQNLCQAIEAYRAALTVYTREAFPDNWATTHSNLGLALSELPTGNRAENLRQAIDAHHVALSILSRDAFPEKWAASQVNLGRALRELPTGDRAENLRRAIEAYRAALTVLTRDAFPAGWATTQNNLGSALRELPTGDRAENLRQAIEAFRAALTIRTRDAFPEKWAMTQNNLGSALCGLPTGDRAENLRQAIEAFRAALSIFTREAFPDAWATTQKNLDDALRELSARAQSSE